MPKHAPTDGSGPFGQVQLRDVYGWGFAPPSKKKHARTHSGCLGETRSFRGRVEHSQLSNYRRSKNTKESAFRGSLSRSWPAAPLCFIPFTSLISKAGFVYERALNLSVRKQGYYVTCSVFSARAFIPLSRLSVRFQKLLRLFGLFINERGPAAINAAEK
jgi:hypothetical protein